MDEPGVISTLDELMDWLQRPTGFMVGAGTKKSPKRAAHRSVYETQLTYRTHNFGITYGGPYAPEAIVMAGLKAGLLRLEFPTAPHVRSYVPADRAQD